MEQILKIIINKPILHIKWLNTLSYLENCGARKIAKTEHPTLVSEEMLKHAAEEFRHAYFLKMQISKLTECIPENYTLSSIFGGFISLRYLDRLELHISRYLKAKINLFDAPLVYLLTTYAIEKRAFEMYPLYDNLLKQTDSPIRIKSILLEEKEHLQEMESALAPWDKQKQLRKMACFFELQIYNQWVKRLHTQLVS